jgi:hypothetical protein
MVKALRSTALKRENVRDLLERTFGMVLCLDYLELREGRTNSLQLMKRANDQQNLVKFERKERWGNETTNIRMEITAVYSLL